MNDLQKMNEELQHKNENLRKSNEALRIDIDELEQENGRLKAGKEDMEATIYRYEESLKQAKHTRSCPVKREVNGANSSNLVRYILF